MWEETFGKEERERIKGHQGGCEEWAGDGRRVRRGALRGSEDLLRLNKTDEEFAACHEDGKERENL